MSFCGRLHARRAELAPNVERWQAFRSHMESFQARKVKQLGRQAAALDVNIAELTNKASLACDAMNYLQAPCAPWMCRLGLEGV